MLISKNQLGEQQFVMVGRLKVRVDTPRCTARLAGDRFFQDVDKRL